MKRAFFALGMLALAVGAALLAFGLARYRLRYENERYFDAQTASVYHEQTAEVCTVTGALLAASGLLLAFARTRRVRDEQPSPRGAHLPP